MPKQLASSNTYISISQATWYTYLHVPTLNMWVMYSHLLTIIITKITEIFMMIMIMVDLDLKMMAMVIGKIK